MNQKELQKKFLKEITKYLNSLTDDDYFKIEIKKCIDINVLHEISINLFEYFGQKHIYINRLSFLNLENIFDSNNSNDNLKIKPSILQFALDSLSTNDLTSLKIDWENEPEMAANMQISSFFIWIGRTIHLIKNPIKDYEYSKIKNEYLGNVLQWANVGTEFNLSEIVLKTTIDYLDNSNVNGNLLLFKFDLKSIYHAFTDNNKQKPPVKNLLNGRKLNISERYLIACKLFDIEQTIRLFDINATEKHRLLSLVLGCNQQTARELFNGTHQKRTPVQEEIVLPYLDKFKSD